MSDSGRKRPGEESPGKGQKRGRGPADCLEDSDEEDFVPFTQENPVPKVDQPVSSKSSGGRNKKKALVKEGNQVFAKKSTAKNKAQNPSKGKCLGKIL